MGKILVRPPPLPKSEIRDETLEIVDAALVRGVRTSIGLVEFGVLVSFKFGDEVYSQLFSLDKEMIGGSIGRILAAAGFTDTDELNEESVKRLRGLRVRVVNRGGRLFFYPLEVKGDVSTRAARKR
ncbi:MAG: hypothetical protein QXI60_03165 [Thermofilaceae archaeon]